MAYSVSDVARLSGVTVRTLHHYDEIGLLSPAGRTSTGYRRYSDADLERLQQILGYRELGFPLVEIATILAEPDDTMAHLRRQHTLVRERIDRLQAMADALEFMMEAQQVGIQLTPQERFEVFGDEDPAQYEQEAAQRWGDTDAYRQSQRRAATYSKQDWQRMKEETDQLYRAVAQAKQSGASPDSEPAMDLAERHRQQISQWFYDCSYEMHRNLAEMYVADQRFTDNIDKYGTGVAAYLRAAIVANADRAAG